MSALRFERLAVLGFDSGPVRPIRKDDRLGHWTGIPSAGFAENLKGWLLFFFALVHAIRSPTCENVRDPHHIGFRNPIK